MVKCPLCGQQSQIHPQHGSVYYAHCVVCNETYCAMCGAFPDHFPAWCADNTEWTQHYINQTNEVNEVLNAITNLNQRRLDMLDYREIIGHFLYDHHPHILFAVDEMRRILRILAMTCVIAFINPGLALLNSVEYTNLVDHFNALHAQLDLNIANNGAFNLAGTRWLAADSVIQLIGQLQLRPVAEFHHAVHVPQLPGGVVNFSQNLTRLVNMWTLLALRRM
ncbi:unnamed protein product [Arabidopsis halleri]